MDGENGLNLTVAVIDVENIANTPTWHVNPAGVEYLNVDPLTGTIEGIKHKDGVVTVTCETYIGSELFSNDYEVFITHFANGTYFLKNMQNNCYAKVKNETIFDNQNAVQHAFDGTDYERWVFELNTLTGYYTIQSYSSLGSTPYYLQVYNNSSAKNAEIVIKSFTGQYIPLGMQWRFESTSDGSYKIIPRTGESPDGVRADYVLATSTSYSSNDNNLKQGEYIDNIFFRDQWFVFNVTDSYDTGTPCDVYYLSIVHNAPSPNGFLTLSPMEMSFEYLQGMGKTHFRFVRTTDIDLSNVLADIPQASIVVIGSHGKQKYKQGQYGTAMLLQDISIGEAFCTKYLHPHDFGYNYLLGDEWYFNVSTEMNKVDLVLFLGCKTAADFRNLCSTSVDAGAKHAVGFTNTISYEGSHPSEIDVWTGAFFEAYSQNSEDIQDCIDYATEKLCNAYFTALMDGDHFGFGSAKYY